MAKSILDAEEMGSLRWSKSPMTYCEDAHLKWQCAQKSIYWPSCLTNLYDFLLRNKFITYQNDDIQKQLLQTKVKIKSTFYVITMTSYGIIIRVAYLLNLSDSGSAYRFQCIACRMSSVFLVHLEKNRSSSAVRNSSHLKHRCAMSEQLTYSDVHAYIRLKSMTTFIFVLFALHHVF